jgi:hypothetical protein
MAYLASTHQFSHCAHRLFNGNFRINAVEVINIYMLYAQTFQRLVTGTAHILRCTIHSPSFAGGIRHDTELRCEYDLVTSPSSEGLTNFYFRISIDVCGIKKVDIQVKRTVNQRNCGLFILSTARVDIRNADAHTSESNC